MITNVDMLNWLDQQIHCTGHIEKRDMLEAIRQVVFTAGQRQAVEQLEIQKLEQSREDLLALMGVDTKGGVT